MATKFGAVALKICRSPMWNFIHATVLPLGMLRRLLYFWKINVYPSCDVEVRSVVQGSCALRLRCVVFVVRSFFLCLVSFSQGDGHCVHAAMSRVLRVAPRYLASKGKGRISKFSDFAKVVNNLCLNSQFFFELLALVLFLLCFLWRNRSLGD